MASPGCRKWPRRWRLCRRRRWLCRGRRLSYCAASEMDIRNNPSLLRRIDGQHSYRRNRPNNRWSCGLFRAEVQLPPGGKSHRPPGSRRRAGGWGCRTGRRRQIRRAQYSFTGERIFDEGLKLSVGRGISDGIRLVLRQNPPWSRALEECHYTGIAWKADQAAGGGTRG